MLLPLSLRGDDVTPCCQWPWSRWRRPSAPVETLGWSLVTNTENQWKSDTTHSPRVYNSVQIYTKDSRTQSNSINCLWSVYSMDLVAGNILRSCCLLWYPWRWDILKKTMETMVQIGKHSRTHHGRGASSLRVKISPGLERKWMDRTKREHQSERKKRQFNWDEH